MLINLPADLCRLTRALILARSASEGKRRGAARLHRFPLLALRASIAALALLLAASRQASAQRPTAPQLLPQTTLAVVRIADMPLLVERFQETAMGRIAQDPRMKPLVAQLFRTAQDTFKQVEEQVGLPLDQLLKIPQGEVCVAFVASTDFEQEAGFVAMIDTKDQAVQARKLLAAAEEIARRTGGGRSIEKFGDEEVNVFTGLDNKRVLSIERDGTFIFATTRPLMETVLANLNGAGLEKTLADNDKYNTLINRCMDGIEQPHLSWYVDPIALVRRLASGSLAATGLALFPVLGLDGLQAAGGTITLAPGEYDGVQHMHILLDNPRVGVIDAVALASGDMTPEAWVPADCVSYSTIHWDLPHTFKVAARLYNGIMGDDAFQQQVRQRIGDPLGIDFEREIMPLLSGRASHVQWVEKPVRINSITTLVGLQLNDPKLAKPILEKVVQKYSDKMERQQYGDITYWSIKGAKQKQREGRADLREPLPCVGIINDYLVTTDSLAAFQEAVTAQSNPDRSLSTSLDFKLIASKIRRLPGGDAPGAVIFQRPEEGLRFWYEMATAEQTKKRLSEQAGKNRFFGSVDQALKDNPLPPFSVLAEYMAPGGGLLVNDPTGIHYTTFTLKRK
jgi:hypothetical protein